MTGTVCDCPPRERRWSASSTSHWRRAGLIWPSSMMERVASGQQWFIELTFRGPSGPSQVRVDSGWSEESFAVESPSGPTLQIQRLTRTPGWHRFAFRFGPEQTEISVDGKELAHGKGPDGPLTAIRLASSPTAKGPPPKGLAGHVDELQLIRFAEPPASLEIDITLDEARLVVGDQLFGEIGQVDSERIEYESRRQAHLTVLE